MAEIDQVLERHGGEITYEAITEMTYLDMVFAGMCVCDDDDDDSDM